MSAHGVANVTRCTRAWPAADARPCFPGQLQPAQPQTRGCHRRSRRKPRPLTNAVRNDAYGARNVWKRFRKARADDDDGCPRSGVWCPRQRTPTNDAKTYNGDSYCYSCSSYFCSSSSYSYWYSSYLSWSSSYSSSSYYSSSYSCSCSFSYFFSLTRTRFLNSFSYSDCGSDSYSNNHL